MSPDWQNKEILRFQYLKKDRSFREIGRRLDCSRETVRYWVDKFDLRDVEPCPICNNQYDHLGKHFDRGNCSYPQLSEYKKSLLQGSLLGDGNFTRGDDEGYSRIQVEMVEKAYIDWITNEFGWLSSAASPYTKKAPQDEDHQQMYGVSTIRHPWIQQEESRWSATEQKRYPEDLTLNDTKLKAWYVGDGFVRWSSTGRPQPGISNRVEIDRSDLLCDIFDSLGLNVTVSSRYDASGTGEIRILDDSVDDFFSLIGEAPPGFKYKWP